jgi:hypothetical protein
MHSSILRQIWLNSPSCIALSFDRFGSTSWHSIWFFGSCTVFTFFFLFRISNFFGLSTTEETSVRIWCIKIGIVLVLHLLYLSGYKYRFVTWSNSMFMENFDHVPSCIYIPIDTLKWYRVTYIYLPHACIALFFDGFGSISWHSICFFRLLHSFHNFFFRISNFFDPSTTEESSRNVHLVHQNWYRISFTFRFVIDNHSRFTHKKKMFKKRQNVEIKTLCHHVLICCDVAVGIYEVKYTHCS